MEIKNLMPMLKKPLEAVRWDGSKQQAEEIVTWARTKGIQIQLTTTISGFDSSRMIQCLAYMDEHEQGGRIAIKGDWVVYSPHRDHARIIFRSDDHVVANYEGVMQ